MTINIFFSDSSFEMQIGGDEDTFLALLCSCMQTSVNEDGKLIVDVLQEKTSKLMDGLDFLVEKYKTGEPRIHKLREKFRKLSFGERFLFVPVELSSEGHEVYARYAAGMNRPDPEKAYQQLSELETQIKTNYSLLQQSGQSTTYIGEPDKEKRVCRYCNRSKPEVSFKDAAHTISESLGNRTIFTNTECDKCNNRYGTGIESDVANYHNFIRAFYHIRGKEGVGTSKANYKVEHPSAGEIKLGIKSTPEQEAAIEKDGHFQIKLDSGLTYTPQNVYKALCKYVIGILPDAEVEMFRSTIEWLDGVRHFPALPTVAQFFPTNFRLENPRLTLLSKTSATPSLPFAIGLVEFTDLAYCFVVPVEGDPCNYADPDLWNRISAALPPFNISKRWRQINFSSTAPAPARVTLNIQPREQPSSEETVS